jgi:radical SAM protein with 4Fe4S-binding SPASM domain
MTGRRTALTLRAWQGGPVLVGSTEPLPRFGSPEVAAYGAVGLDDGAENSEATTETYPAQQSPDGSRAVYDIPTDSMLPLIGHVNHHLVDSSHLWIGVENGTLIVAEDEAAHTLMSAFVEGSSPNDAAQRLCSTHGFAPADAGEMTARFVARLVANGFVRGIRGYHSVKRIRPHAFARFHLTQRCQLSCVHCYTSSSPLLPSDNELPVERWIQLVDEFADNGGEQILFTGGEALVYKGCIDIMRRAHEAGLEVTLFSNGMLIPRYIDDLVEVADVVQISVDGPNAETHDAIRGRHSFRRAMRAIRLLLDAGMDTRVSTTIMLNNWEAIRAGLPDFIAEFEETDLSFRISYGAMAHGRGTSLDHTLDTEEVRRFVDGLLSRVKTTENRDAGPNAVQKISNCGYAEQLVIAPDGLVYPCHLLSGALGHVDQLPVRDITKYLARTAQAFSVNSRVGCSTCDLRNLCGGSCRVEDEKHTGSRLVTTCTPEEKLRKKRFLVRRYTPNADKTLQQS